MNLLSRLARLFKRKTARKPRRAKCACGHAWQDHSAKGCAWADDVGRGVTACGCRLNREGKVSRRALRAVQAAS